MSRARRCGISRSHAVSYAEGIAWYQVVTPEGLEGWCDGAYLQSV